MASPHIVDIEALKQEKEPLISPPPSPQPEDNPSQITPIQRALRDTFKSTAELAKRLPTGTALTFQLLSPIFTNEGHCTCANKVMTACLIALCGLSCIVLSFSDTYVDGNGKVRHGIATFSGLWVIDGVESLAPEVAATYKIRVIDFVHAFMTLLVFVAVALFDQNAVGCFFPVPAEGTEQVLTCLPVGIGVVCSYLFVTFPNTRHGIGFPLSKY